jgi:hypothetical protein
MSTVLFEVLWNKEGEKPEITCFQGAVDHKVKVKFFVSHINHGC